jgi:hypothetical protein
VSLPLMNPKRAAGRVIRVDLFRNMFQQTPQCEQEAVERRLGCPYFQGFALSELFRNQQVAGSSPAGGSIFPLIYLSS